jgi:hypothetical protein
VELALVVVVVALALGFDYTNGFHDAANAIATSALRRCFRVLRRGLEPWVREPDRSA